MLGFVLLFRLTEYRGQDEPSEPLNLIFRIDPLTAAAAMLGRASWIHLAWPALILLGLTLVFGRFFCGWICPLGTLLDAGQRAARPLARRTQAHVPLEPLRRLRPARFVLLILVLLAAALGLPMVGFLDPLALLYRALAFSIDPFVGEHGSRWVAATPALQQWSDAARSTLFPFTVKTYALAGVSLGILLGIMLAELLARRFWCRYLCPLGAMLGLAARFASLARLPRASCGNCSATATCAEACRMDAFDKTGLLHGDACTLCMECVGDCPSSKARFAWRRPRPAAIPIDLSRRAAMTTIAAGVALPLAARAAGISGHAPGPHLLRPPGAAPDDTAFTNACVRCGLCMKVCPTNALQPAALQAGIEGIFSPVLTPRIGYCELGCTLCGQVCPTGALPVLSMEQKEQAIMGKAVIDRTRCLPWASGEECLCCEEHCPIWDKAIVFRPRTVTRPDGAALVMDVPYIRFDSCIGCGICEARCPVEGESPIRVVRPEFARHQDPDD